VTNAGETTVYGDLGVSPGLAITGFPPGLVLEGAMRAGGALALQAQNDVTAAYLELAGDRCAVDLSGQDLGGRTLTQGVYCFSSEAQLTGTLTLDAQGDPGAVFVFQIGSKLTTASNASVVFINGGQDCRTFWQVGSSATLRTDTVFAGSILALTSIALQTGATVSGRALARNGAVTMDTNHIFARSCARSDAVLSAGQCTKSATLTRQAVDVDFDVSGNLLFESPHGEGEPPRTPSTPRDERRIVRTRGPIVLPTNPPPLALLAAWRFNPEQAPLRGPNNKAPASGGG
jgi:hypothetical protein